jgi:hypothetical protein
MKTRTRNLLLLLAVVLASPLQAREEQGRDVRHTSFVGYEGPQKWPTGQAVGVIRDNAVPIYLGLPSQSYRVLGRIVDMRRGGFDEVGRAFSEAFSSEKARMGYCANQAVNHGGDTVLVTGDPRVISALKLTPEDLHRYTPLLDQKDKVTLVIKFLGPPPPVPTGAPVGAPRPAF